MATLKALSMKEASAPLRSYLFVPASRPERFAKALNSGADAVIIDLEDAVAPQDKRAAQQAVLDYLTASEASATPVFIRINGLHSAEGLRNLLAICDMSQHIAKETATGIVIPKAACAEDISLVADVLDDTNSGLQIGALIETIDGVENAGKIARASDRLRFIMFGGADMALDLRVPMAWDSLLSARAAVVRAAAAAHIDSLDMPWIDLNDNVGYEQEMARSFSLGFTARAAIHPTQIAAIHAALTPTDAAIAQAKAVVAAWDASGGGVATLNGKLIEKPLIAGALRILALAKRAQKES